MKKYLGQVIGVTHKMKALIYEELLLEQLDKMEQGYKDIGEHNCYVSRIIHDTKTVLIPRCRKR